jgi:DNA-binding NarL/FixJ family response regulator
VRCDNGETDGFGLTPRQLAVLRLLADGRSNREIGEKLSITEGAVKAHLVTIFTKMGVSSRTEAVAVAFRSGLVR